MTLSNPCSIGNARAAALCLVRIGNEKRRPLSSHVRRLTYHVCGSFMDNKESRFQLFLLVYEPAARGFLARFALLIGQEAVPLAEEATGAQSEGGRSAQG